LYLGSSIVEATSITAEMQNTIKKYVSKDDGTFALKPVETTMCRLQRPELKDKMPTLQLYKSKSNHVAINAVS
jgi:hypothetical protein